MLEQTVPARWASIQDFWVLQVYFTYDIGYLSWNERRANNILGARILYQLADRLISCLSLFGRSRCLSSESCS